MKTRTYIALALCGLVLASCGKKKEEKPFTDYSLSEKSSKIDSVSYFLGENIAVMRTEPNPNNFLETKEDRKNFDEGFEAGLAAGLKKGKAYNYGLMIGTSMAFEFLNQGETLGEEFNLNAIASGFKKSFDNNGELKKEVQASSIQHQQYVQAAMQQLQAKANQKKADEALKKTETAKKSLPGVASKEGYSEVNGIYLKTLTPGDGHKLQNGDKVMAIMSLCDEQGTPIYPSSPVPQEIGVTNTYSPALDAVLTTLEMNGKYSILGTVDQLFSKDMATQGVLSGQFDPEKIYMLVYEVSPESNN